MLRLTLETSSVMNERLTKAGGKVSWPEAPGGILHAIRTELKGLMNWRQHRVLSPHPLLVNAAGNASVSLVCYVYEVAHAINVSELNWHYSVLARCMENTRMEINIAEADSLIGPAG